MVLHILFGSQTGQAKAIAEEISESATEKGISHQLHCLSLVDKKFSIEKLQTAVFVVSTTGEGEPPETTLKFFRRLKKRTLASDHLSNLNYALLGLGDSNYANFCNFGKTLNKRLQELGAKTFYTTGCADDAVGLEVVVEPWIEGLWLALENYKNSTTSNNASVITVNGDKGHCLTNGHNIDEQITNDINKKVVLNGHSEPTVSDKELSEKRSLTNSANELRNSVLKVPLCPKAYLSMKNLQEADTTYPCYEDYLKSMDYPSSTSPVFFSTISSSKKLTDDPLAKQTFIINLSKGKDSLEYAPGDSIGVVCPNRDADVNLILERLGLLEDADKPFELDVLSSTTKKGAAVPNHIPKPCTPRFALKYSLDITSVPKKSLLRMLVDYSTNENDKRRLQELCSTQGAEDYQEFIRQPCAGFTEILSAFKSCVPPLIRLIEMLPWLQARPYSICSSPLRQPTEASIVYNLVELPWLHSKNEARSGLCTSWLKEISSNHWSTSDPEEKSSQPIKVPIFLRKATKFRLPDNPSTPIIMIGPGTGVAPFIGFLQQRFEECERNKEMKLGPMHLFYGCRYEDKDFLFRDNLRMMQEKGILTNLFTSFSRDPCENQPPIRYVQDNILLQKDLVLETIFKDNGIVYICGDAKNMARGVLNTFSKLIQQFNGINELEALQLINQLRKNGQYVEDIWT